MAPTLRVTLIKPGTIVPELYYGPYSFYWLGQQTKVCLNEVDFILTIQTGSGNNKLMPMYCCQSGLHVVTEPGYQAMGWNDKNILETLKQDIQHIPVTRYAGSGFQSSLLHMYERKQSIFVSRIEGKKCIVEIYRESALIKQFKGATPDEVWEKTGQLKKFTGTQLYGLDNPITKNLIQQHRTQCTLNDWNDEYILERLFDYHVKRRTLANANWKYFFTSWVKTENPIIELEPALHAIYPKGYEFSERELSAWQTMLKAASATNITPWLSEESKRQLWTKSPNGEADKVAFAALYKSGFLTSIPKNMPNATHTFWMCFERALANNKKTPDGKRRILSIISNEFTYGELKQNLNVGSHTIVESRKHARINGYGSPLLVKPIICRRRFTPEMLEQIDRFLNDKEFGLLHAKNSVMQGKKCIVEIYRESALIKQFKGATPDEVWEKTGQLKKFTGTQLYGLDNPITKNLIQQHRTQCTLNDWNDEYILERLFDYHVKRRTLANANWKYFFTSWVKTENPIIELEPALHAIYPKGYEFSERELSAWQTMLKAASATNITPWLSEESKRQLWTKSPNGEADKVAFAALYKSGFLTSIPKNMPNATHTFWMCFERALANNKKTPDGKRRILSIISNEFTYGELKQNLNVGSHTIVESRKHARINGYGSPLLVKPIICRRRFTPEMLEQIDRFLNDKEFVNMSSYKTDAKSGKPIKYLQDTKKALWERFAEEYPNGMRHTSFMTCLEGGQYVYRENLGGLCSTCNDCGYMVFGDIGVIISAHVMDEPLKKRLLTKSQELRRYIHREYSKELEVTAAGIAVHNSCISHCIRHAFGDCNLNHPVTCSKCESIFSFFEELKAAIKELDEEGAVMIVDYKMRILPQSARETKTEFFGKRGWSFHSVLVYTKNMEQNQLDVQVFDHWSNDTRQDAWFTASSLHTVIETLNPKSKWVTIMSDNGMHYHCTELMLIIAHWKEWYNIIPRKWIFLEAGEAKTSIDSHHAQLGYDVISGDDIELAVKGIAGVRVSNLNPNRDNGKL
ncbi:hypothetical protein RhiirA4_471939 [Rhizophagus irregularis]|uniref:Uncharacterized protein n=1 Tax=Rhizophagus irregularis TaxID=588596 RepID=A0A2I1H400_9GLOM|nr:hypothetical protein RhiirA4_471939 [Rhizophagus irregularis]